MNGTVDRDEFTSHPHMLPTKEEHMASLEGE